MILINPLKKEQGFGLIPLMLMCLVLIIVIVALIFFVFTKKNQDKTAIKIDTSKIDFSKCTKRDYGGCNDDPNFHVWKDDGKP